MVTAADKREELIARTANVKKTPIKRLSNNDRLKKVNDERDTNDAILRSMYEKKQKEEAARLEVFNREQAIELQEKNDKNELRRRRVKANKAAIEAGRYTS